MRDLASGSVRWARWLFAAASFLGLLLVSGSARADDVDHPASDTHGSPYRLKWPYDAAIVAVSAASTLPTFIGQHEASCYPSCEAPRGMLPIDRSSLGNYSPAAHMGANVVVATLLGAPLLIDAVDSRFHGWAEDTFVFLETILATQGATQLTKSAVGRPAPLLYAPNVAPADYESADAHRSFFSGHTSTAFSAATAYSVTFWKRHPTSPMRFVVLGVSEAAALAVGLLKIKAGYHYATDVAAGALVGSAFGLFLPVAHATW
jgi:membrane-associated phospholipid phosphatase